MRACEGCRRRKIKCDAASTNTWPCSACTRLKLHCIPPTGGNDRDYAGPGSLADSEEPVEYSLSQTHDVNGMHAQPQPTQQYGNLSSLPVTDSIGQYARPNIGYQLNSYTYSSDVFREHYFIQDQPTFPTSHPTVQVPQPYRPNQPPAQVRHDSNVSASESEHPAAEDLSEALGELKIAEIGIGTFTSSASFAITANGSLSTLYKTAGKELYGAGWPRTRR